MKKHVQLLSIIISFVLIVASFPAFSAAGEEGALEVATLDELKAALEHEGGDASDPLIIRLTADIEQTGTTDTTVPSVKAGSYVVIESAKKADGGSYSLIQSGKQVQSKIYNRTAVIKVYGHLTLKDITIDAASSGRAVSVEPGGYLTLESGTLITGGTPVSANIKQGLGVYVAAYAQTASDCGHLTINEGASISGNCQSASVSSITTPMGLGVYCAGVTVMNGGAINGNIDSSGNFEDTTLNKNAVGGGIYVTSSADNSSPDAQFVQFTMNGGTISGNTASCGGGLYASENALVRINSGLITGNSALRAGGGIALSGILTTMDESYKRLDVRIEDGAVISDNTAMAGGGIYATYCRLAVSGAEIRDNTAVTYKDGPSGTGSLDNTICSTISSGGSGGGIYIAGANVTLSAVKITGNTASVSAGEDVVYARGNGGGIFVEGTDIFPANVNIGSDTYISSNQAWGAGEFAGKGGGIAVGFYSGSTTTINGSRVSVKPEVHLTDVQITANKAEAGNDACIFDVIPYKTSASGDTGYTDYIHDSPSVYVEGAVQIGEFYLMKPQEANDTTGISEAVLKVEGRLESKIGIICQDESEGTVVARSTDKYKLSSEDLEGFEYAGSSEGAFDNDSEGNIFFTSSAVEKTDITQASVTIEGDIFYDGTEKKPEVTVMLDGESLGNGTDYALSYSDNTDAGFGTVLVTGIGRFGGRISREFTILPRSFESSSEIAAGEVRDSFYTGRAITPSVTVTDTLDGETLILTEGKDYELSYSDNINAGRGTIHITGQGNYTGSLDTGFSIVSAPSGYIAVSSEEELRSALSGQSKYIYLAESFSAGSPVRTDYDVLINGNGFTLSYSGEKDGRYGVIYVSKGTLSLVNMTIDSRSDTRCIYVSEGTLNADDIVCTGGYNKTDGISICNAGSMTLENTAIRNAAVVDINYRGVIYNSGSLTIKEGVANDPSAYSYAGTVFNTGIFNLEGGSLTGLAGLNNHQYGAAVTSSGTFLMSGGSIRDSNGNSAVLITGEASAFRMTGGTINGNNATSVLGSKFNIAMSGGGVLVRSGGSFTMDGGVISGNISYMGAGVGVDGSSSVFTMNGGSITGNTARGNDHENSVNENNACGGGVGVYDGGTFNMNGGSITGNIAKIEYESDDMMNNRTHEEFNFTGLGGAVFVLTGTVNIKGGSISDNVAGTDDNYGFGGFGGGICVYDPNNTSVRGRSVLHITGGSVSGNTSMGGQGDDIFCFVDQSSADDKSLLYTGGAAQIGDLFLNDNKLVIGIEQAITTMRINSSYLLGKEIPGETIAAYSEGVASKESDIERIGYKGCWSIRLDDTGRKIILDSMDLKDVRRITIDDVMYTGQELTNVSLTGHLEAKNGTVLDLPGLPGLMISSVAGITDQSADMLLDAGEYRITLEGRDGGSFSGRISGVNVKITPKDLSSDGFKVVINNGRDVYYDIDDRTPSEPLAELILESTETALDAGPYGDITIAYSDNTAPGSGRITFTAREGAGSNFTGSRAAEFEILEHEHAFTAVSSGIKVQATCQAQAVYYAACSLCGRVSDTVTIEAGGLGTHKEEVIPAVAATYEQTGWTEGSRCALCGEVLVSPEKTPLLHTDGLSLKSENSTYYYYKDNKIVSDFTGLVKSGGETWYIRRGTAALNYNGIIEYENEYWYIQSGKVAYVFSGNILWKGKVYQVTAGKAK